VLNNLDCSQFTLGGNQVGCEGAGCFWIDDGANQFCVDRPLDFSCSVYQSPGSCSDDIWNIGREGFGTEICNQYASDGASPETWYAVLGGSCECVWDSWSNPGGGGGMVTTPECLLKYKVSPDIYWGVEDSFKCIKDFDSTLCVEGVQNVSWNAKTYGATGIFTGVIPSLLKTNSECVNGWEERACGEPIIRLPGFSFFAMISSILLIGVYYFFRREEE